MSDKIRFKGAFKIRTSEVDHQKKLSVPNLMQLMHEAAMQNVIDLKISVWDLQDQHLSWVLMRKKLTINRLPSLGESIYIETYPAGFEKLITYRDYLVHSENGELLAHTSSAWLLMDTEKRRMARIPAYMHEYDLPKPEDCLPRPVIRVPKLETADYSNFYKVNWFDLDFNGHLGNVNYVKWMLETLNEETLQDHRLSEFSISYKHECHWKEEVFASTQRLSDTDYLHCLKRKSDDKVLALASSKWIKANR